jgi:predicted DNA-binding transcriptional regulator AlpA
MLDEDIASHLTKLGHSSPKKTRRVLPSTVKSIRLKHRIFQKKCQSHPRHIPGYLTIPQIAPALGVTAHWIYHYIRSGKILVDRDPQTQLYLFPDQPDTLEKFNQLKAGLLHNLRF